MSKIYKFINELCGSNCYIVINRDEYIVIDPCVNKELFESKVIDKKCIGVFLTHGHYDHFCNIEDFDYDNYKIHMHKEAFNKINNLEHNYAKFFGRSNRIDLLKESVVFLNEGEFVLSGFNLFIIETPGHSNCSICIKMGDNLFSGDTLFKESVGRTDLYSSKASDLSKSLSKLSKLSRKTIVYPGHEEETSLDYELKHNPFLIRGAKNV